ncbi:protein NRT1/ PTR FAMILY 5.5-like, partial [Morus notabilis]|uniref:protein NRT1/ PTR FAMILY 5.5-like n=1 Tax=Morus notabilis TaxID=981085 RepID=UPI000CED0530
QLSRLSKTLKVVLTIIIHLVGALAIPYINSWPLRFGIPAICMLVATIIFWRGRFRSSHASTERPKERPVITVLRVLVASFLGTFDKNLTNSAEPNAREDDRSIVRSSHLRCLHRATNYNLSNHNPELEINRWKHCTVEEVEEAKKAICGIPFCIAFFVLGIISSLGDTYFIQQAETMNPMIGNWDVPLQILQLFCLLAKAVIAKSYSKIADKFYGNARSKSARRLDEVEKHMLYVTYNTVPLTMFSLVPQYLLLGGLDGIVEESIDLFFSDPAPNSCNQFMGGFAYGFGTIGSILSVYLARHISAWGDDTSWFEDHLNDSRFDKYCWVMTGQSAGNFIFCLILYYLTDLRLAASTESHPQATTSVDVNNEIELVELDSAVSSSGGGRYEGDGGEKSDHHGRWHSDQNQAVLLVRFSSSLCSESIGTGITSIGHRTAHISRSEVWVYFVPLAAECGVVRRSWRLEDTNPDSARRDLSNELGGIENGRRNLTGGGSAVRGEKERK